MRTASRAGVGAAAAALAVGGSAAVSWADQQPSLSVTPSTPGPVAHVTLVQNGGCAGRSVRATSAGLADTATLTDRGGSRYVGSARVSPHAKAGRQYMVTTHCQGRESSTLGGFTVGQAAQKGSRAGEGGSITGTNWFAVAVGDALLVAAAAGSVMTMRRRGVHDT